jgi:hypothetical protein
MAIARAVVQDTGEPGVVTDDMVQEQLHKEMVSQMDDTRAKRLLKKIFDGLAWAVADAKTRMNSTLQHRHVLVVVHNCLTRGRPILQLPIDTTLKGSVGQFCWCGIDTQSYSPWACSQTR